MAKRRVNGTSLAGMAAATPADRDRYVDLLRALSILVVVFGHWLMAIVYWHGQSIDAESALEVIPWTWALTWVLQIMPLFFFVGGFSNLVGYRAAKARGQSYGDFVAGRLHRLMAPTTVFIGAWLVVSIVMDKVFGLGSVLEAAALIAKPLWFLAVYAIVIALAPVMIALHERYRLWVPLAMVGAAVTIDIARIAFEVPFIGYLNFAFVWLFPHQLGLFYGDGTLVRLGHRVHGALVVGGLGALVALVSTGIYSQSMVGVTSDKVSNNDPPSICLIALTTWMVGAAMLLKPAADRLVARASVWKAVIAVNSCIMTIFLWHLTALMITVAIAYPLGWPQFAGGTTGWWLTRPVWMALLTVSLIPFVVVFGRFERKGLRRASVSGARPGRVLAGTALLVAGIGGLAEVGFAGAAAITLRAPLVNTALVGSGKWLLRAKRGA